MPCANAPQSPGQGAARTGRRGGVDWQEVKGWGAASGLGSPRGTKQPLFHLCPAPRLLSTITQQLPVPEQPQSHRRGEHEAARAEAGRWVGWRDEVCGSSGRDRSRTGQDQAVLGYLMQAAELGLLLSISSAHFTAPVHLEAGLQLLPCPQGLILRRVGRRRKEALKHEACPRMGYMDCTPVLAHFGNVEARKLLGHLPTTSPCPPHHPTHTSSSGTSKEPGPWNNKPPKARSEQSLPQSSSPA